MSTSRVATITLSLVALLAGCDAARVRAIGSPDGGASPASTLAASTLASPIQPTGSGGAFVPTLATIPCPDDVASQVVQQITCQNLTVLEDRAKPAGRTIKVFVMRIEPPGGTTTPDPVLVLGALGNLDDYGSMANAGQRTHRLEYLVDLRGLGHSQPSLACPEVEAAAPALAGLRLSDPARTTALVAAVRSCHDRLTGQGIDPAMYDAVADAADMDDLRAALGIPIWNLISTGSNSRIAFEIARRYGPTIRSSAIDSPHLPAPSLLDVGPVATDGAIGHLVALCKGQPACSRAAPDLDAMIRAAIAKLDRTPIVDDVAGTIAAINLGHPIHTVIDGAGLLRWIRARLGASGGAQVSTILPAVSAVLDGSVRATDGLVVDLASDQDDCAGVLAICEQLVIGSVYSIVCRDEAPRVDQAALAAAISGRPADVELFGPGPLVTACGGWAVDPAPAAPAGPLSGGVPTLVMRGVLDPYSASIAAVRAADPAARALFTFDVPNQSYNILGYNECPRAIRNAWIDQPTIAPDVSCLGSIPELSMSVP